MDFSVILAGDHVVDVVGPTWRKIVKLLPLRHVLRQPGPLLTAPLQLEGLVSHEESLKGAREQAVIRAKHSGWVHRIFCGERGAGCWVQKSAFESVPGYGSSTTHSSPAHLTAFPGLGFELPELEQGPLRLRPDFGAGLWNIFRAVAVPICGPVCLPAPPAAPWPFW